jgi:hypothetical protein
VYTRGLGAEKCPDEAALRQAVAKRLGYDPFFPSADRTIVASITLDNDKLKGQAELVDDHGIVRGTRDYTAPANECNELVYALALSISISIDPASAERSGPPNPPAAAPPERRDQPAMPATAGVAHAEPAPSPLAVITKPDERDLGNTTSSATPAPKGEWQWSVALDARVMFNSSPSTIFGGAAGISGRVRRFGGIVELGASWPSVSNVASAGGSVSLKTSNAWMAALPCVHFDPAFLCGVMMVGRFSAHRDDNAAIGDTHTTAAAGGRLGGEAPLGDAFSFRISGDLLANLVRTPVTVEGVEVWRAPVVWVSLSAALVFRFP